MYKGLKKLVKGCENIRIDIINYITGSKKSYAEAFDDYKKIVFI